LDQNQKLAQLKNTSGISVFWHFDEIYQHLFFRHILSKPGEHLVIFGKKHHNLSISLFLIKKKFISLFLSISKKKILKSQNSWLLEFLIFVNLKNKNITGVKKHI
jgi:hypothetical protein